MKLLIGIWKIENYVFGMTFNALYEILLLAHHLVYFPLHVRLCVYNVT